MKSIILITLLFLTSINIFPINTTIYSKGVGTFEELFTFLSLGNSSLGDELVTEFVETYMEESYFEGINWDVSFVQMCLETGFLQYGGLVEYSQNNFCGLGSFDGKSGAKFDSIREGVRAHIQHLKAYASNDKLNSKLIDPRFHLVKRSSATDIKDLAGKWAEDPLYGIKLYDLLDRMLNPNLGEIILLADASSSNKGSEENIEHVIEEEIVSEVVIPKANTLQPKENKPEKHKGWDW